MNFSGLSDRSRNWGWNSNQSVEYFLHGGQKRRTTWTKAACWQVGQTGKMLSCLFYEWVLGFLLVCDFASTKGLVDLRCRLPMWWLNWFKILSFSQVLLVLRLLHPVAVVVIFSTACHLQYRQQWPKSKSCWVLSSEKEGENMIAASFQTC